MEQYINKIRTRFAPSPTGELHIGGARTALFAYLFAKSQKGEFLLRIEDTDRERYVKDSDKRIIESLAWLGINPDNKDKMVVQSERLDIYKNAALELLQAGKAYVCTCSPERLLELRKHQQSKFLPTGYDGACRSNKIQVTSYKQLEDHLKEGAVVRMKMPKKGEISIEDLVRGKVTFDASLLDDQIILKSDGFPTYHLASIVDDHEMKITHVIRAEEWLPSTPKHIILYEAFGWEPPKFAHLSMILPPDRKGKLSKRHGATSVLEYRDEGYLPEALVNFMVLLGWNPKTNEEFFTLEELINEFKIENLNKAPAVFDIAKLKSFNEFYFRNSVTSNKGQATSYLKNFIKGSLSSGELDIIGRGGFSTLKEAAEYIEKLRTKPNYEGNLLIFGKSTKEKTLKGLQLTVDCLQLMDDKEWNNQNLQMELGLVVTRNDLTNGDVFWPVRVALSGEEKSPSPVELMLALGKEESLNRLKNAINKLT